MIGKRTTAAIIFHQASQGPKVFGLGDYLRRSWVVLVFMGLSGCLFGARIIASPLTVSEQQRAVLEVAPMGLPREEVAARLAQAGIEYSPGTNDSIWYCDIWNRENGERWHMNVALLFDDRGQLYLTRPAEGSLDIQVRADQSQQPATPVPVPDDVRTPFVPTGGMQ